MISYSDPFNIGFVHWHRHLIQLIMAALVVMGVARVTYHRWPSGPFIGWCNSGSGGTRERLKTIRLKPPCSNWVFSAGSHRLHLVRNRGCGASLANGRNKPWFSASNPSTQPSYTNTSCAVTTYAKWHKLWRAWRSHFNRSYWGIVVVDDSDRCLYEPGTCPEQNGNNKS